MISTSVHPLNQVSHPRHDTLEFQGPHMPTHEFQSHLEFQGLKISLESFCKGNLEKRLKKIS